MRPEKIKLSTFFLGKKKIQSENKITGKEGVYIA